MRSCGLLTLNYIKMTIEEAGEKLSNMHFDNIVKSYCNKVNDIKRLKAEIKKLNEQLRIHDVVDSNELLKSFKQFLQSEYHLTISNRMIDEFKNK